MSAEPLQVTAEIKANQKISGENINAFWQPAAFYISARSLKRRINALRKLRPFGMPAK